MRVRVRVWVRTPTPTPTPKQRSNVSKYVSSLREGRELEWDGRQIKVGTPPNKP